VPEAVGAISHPRRLGDVTATVGSSPGGGGTWVGATDAPLAPMSVIEASEVWIDRNPGGPSWVSARAAASLGYESQHARIAPCVQSVGTDGRFETGEDWTFPAV